MLWLKNLWLKLFAKKDSVPNEPEKKRPVADKWMLIALAEKGVKEISGGKDHPRILEYGNSTTYHFEHDEVPWCSAYVNWVFLKANMKRTNSAAAASWLKWGKPLDIPVYGCVVVKSRTGGNHVTFFIRPEMRDGEYGFIGLGGNQGNQVCEMWYPNKTVRGYRWPEDAK